MPPLPKNDKTPLGAPAGVRLATREDEEALFDLLVALHKNNSNGWGFAYRPEIVLARIEQGTRPDPATRTNPHDQRRGIIGVIDGPHGRLIGSVGLFLEPPVWFTDAVAMVELWLFVRSEVRGRRRHEEALFDYAKWAHATMKAGMPQYPLPFPMSTGFMHRGNRIKAMERLWRRRSGGKKIGVLFAVD